MAQVMNEIPPTVQESAAEASSPTFWDQVGEFLSGSPGDWLSWQVWVIATIVLLVAEVMTAGFIIAAFTPGTVLAAVLAAFGASMPVQVIAFSVGTLIGLIYLRPIFLRRVMDHGVPTNTDALVGEIAEVVDTIPKNGVGRVKVRSEEWRARGNVALEPGMRVTVTSVEGNTLTVSLEV